MWNILSDDPRYGRDFEKVHGNSYSAGKRLKLIDVACFARWRRSKECSNLATVLHKKSVCIC